MTEFQTQLNSTNQLATSIQDARRAKNMTQTELSTITGIPRPWINQLEHGHIENPGFTKLLKIMDALEMRISVSYAIHESTQDSPEEKTSPAPRLPHSPTLTRTSQKTKSLQRFLPWTR